MSGISPTAKDSVRSRRKASAKASDRKTDALIAKATTPAPLMPSSDGYLRLSYRRRDNGSVIQVLDTAVAQQPSDALPDEGEAGRFAVRCVTHGTTLRFPTFEDASDMVRTSPRWCDGCAQPTELAPKVNARARKTTS